MVSKASDDFPEPDSPVKTTSRSRGISRSTFLRLCSRAPRIVIARMADPALYWRFALITSSITGVPRALSAPRWGRASPGKPENPGQPRQALPTDLAASVEVIVDATLDAVGGETEIDARRQQCGQIALGTVVGIHVFNLGRPVRCEHVFATAANRPARVNLGLVDHSRAQHRGREAIVSPGIAAFGVEQGCARGHADAAGDAAERADLVFRARHRKAAEESGRRILDVRAGGVDLKTPNPHAAGRLPVVTDGAAAEAAREVVVPGITAHDADIEARPVDPRRDSGRFGVRARGKISGGSLSCHADGGQGDGSEQKILHRSLQSNVLR